MPQQMVELGGDVAGVQVDHHRLHLPDVGGLGAPVPGHRAGDDVERRPFPRGPGGEVERLVPHRIVGLDPDVVRAAGEALALIDEAAERDPALAVGEDDVEEERDLRRIRLQIERVVVDHRRRVVEVAPGIKLDDIIAVVAHAGRLQQRCDQAHIRHSW